MAWGMGTGLGGVAEDGKGEYELGQDELAAGGEADCGCDCGCGSVPFVAAGPSVDWRACNISWICSGVSDATSAASAA